MSLCPGADVQRAGTLPLHGVAGSATAEKNAEVAARALHRLRYPQDGVILLFERRPIGRSENLQRFHPGCS
jgi:hypothetical protein